MSRNKKHEDRIAPPPTEAAREHLASLGEPGVNLGEPLKVDAPQPPPEPQPQPLLDDKVAAADKIDIVDDLGGEDPAPGLADDPQPDTVVAQQPTPAPALEYVNKGSGTDSGQVEVPSKPP
jgi:hypothetical protein